jgi:prepilin-type N-terminal cleavage/methylation domain-containing protein/prepilin-type processing-associated H-X9-DG protein
MKSKNIKGFTLIECLVVIFIISLIFAILLPAVFSARESARRLECLNHLKQIGIALQNYNSLHEYFPAINSRTTPFRGSSYGSAQAYSPLARMLCDLDQTPLFNSINFTGVTTSGWVLVNNLTVMQTSLSVCLCPSDTDSLNPVLGYGRVNYRFCTGPSLWISPSPSLPGSLDGPFTVHYFYRASDFTDGLSNTIGISERLQGDWQKAAFKKHGDYYAVAICSNLSVQCPHDSKAGESWLISGFHFTDYNHCLTPNSSIDDCALDASNQDLHARTLHAGLFTSSSYHPGGVNAAFMDGSVKFIQNGISSSVWRALSTRNSGDVVDEY